MLKLLKSFVAARDGLAAIEFAFIAPVLAILLLGTVEACNALQANQRVNNAASSVADLVAQESNLTTNELPNIYGAGSAIIFPFPSTNASIVITSIVNKANQNTVCWSQAKNGTAYAKGTVMTVPAGVIASGGSAVLVQVSNSYTSPVGKLIVGTITMSSLFYSHPRLTPQVGFNSTTC